MDSPSRKRRRKADAPKRHSMPEAAAPGIDLTSTLGLEEGMSIEVLWTMEDVDTCTRTDVWWPARLLPATRTVCSLPVDDSDQESVDVVDSPILYSPHESFPDWIEEEDLLSSVCFVVSVNS
jgi:hypothetical protein